MGIQFLQWKKSCIEKEQEEMPYGVSYYSRCGEDFQFLFYILEMGLAERLNLIFWVCMYVFWYFVN